MTTPKRERRDRRADVHQAAIETFCAKGFAGASMQDVADAVGVLKGSLYHYVASKDELLQAIFRAAADQTDERIAEVSALEVAPAERLRQFIERQVLWYLEHPDHATVLVREWRFVQGKQRQIVEKYRLGYEQFVRTLIEDCVRADVAHPGLDVAHALHFVLGPMDATPEWYRASQSDSAAHIARISGDLAVRAVVRYANEPNVR